MEKNKINKFATVKKFSKDYLTKIRKNIDITDVIVYHLKIEHKIYTGYFRFLCPVCKEFNTAVNPKTNLARCFKCAVNFNTIDLVMAIKHCNFLDAVAFLDNCLLE